MNGRRWIAVCVVALLSGFTMSRAPTPHPRPILTEGEQETRPSAPVQPVAVKWIWPCAVPDYCLFLGDLLLYAPPGQAVVRALDKDAKPIWEFPAQSAIVDIAVNVERREAIIFTLKDSNWISLADGKHLGAGPSPLTVSDTGVVHGHFIWKGDYALRSVLRFVPPVDPKAPGKSPEYVEYWLLHLNRDRGVWEDQGLLVEKGSVTSMSADGRIVLINKVNSAQLYRDGQPQVAFAAADRQGAVFYLSAQGDYVVGHSEGMLDLHTAEGKLLWKHAEKGLPVNTYSHHEDVRIVLRYEDKYAILNGNGDTMLSGDGRLSYFAQSRPGFVFVESGAETRLVTIDGETIATYPAGPDELRTTADGKWAFYGQGGSISVYPVPDQGP